MTDSIYISSCRGSARTDMLVFTAGMRPVGIYVLTTFVGVMLSADQCALLTAMSCSCCAMMSADQCALLIAKRCCCCVKVSADHYAYT